MLGQQRDSSSTARLVSDQRQRRQRRRSSSTARLVFQRQRRQRRQQHSSSTARLVMDQWQRRQRSSSSTARLVLYQWQRRQQHRPIGQTTRRVAAVVVMEMATVAETATVAVEMQGAAMPVRRRTHA